MTESVAINARAAARTEIGGVERVAREMASRLPRLRPDRYRVVQPPAALAHLAGHAWEQGVLPLAARGARLIYSPANLAPLAAGSRNVVVIHDLAALRHPEWYSRAYVAWQRALLPRLAGRAARVITVSEFSRSEIADLLGVDAAVVPNGVDGDRFHLEAEPMRRERPYVLLVGTRIARKNTAALDEAARRLASEGIDLVAAGSGRAYMRDGAGTSAVTALGYVPDADLPALYAGARALAMPSLYEGFGLPCIEAMACGTPVVAADRAALPETCGGAALLADPDEPGAFADALVRAATVEDERALLRERGAARAARFSWDRTAELTDRVVGELLSA
ncbi:MAG: glycosyltransferase family 4 protein [Thermoleophilaceae bacterium]